MNRFYFSFLTLATCVLAARIPRDAMPEPVADAAPDAQRSEKKQQAYTSKFENIDLDQILKSDRLLKNYVNCLMDRGSCTPDASELKRLLPDALESECSKCSEKQRAGAEKVIKHIIDNKPEQWKELEAKYDPKGIYKQKYKALAEEKGYKVE
ncbi:ejaculatory bulb-specific protein 3-like [Cloeon dipterum]|uniref:ejaculatory bulb-specific protein 3-like n=1 Tax=Cloeon dipterum TaxID=197152 RepID=UPI0032204BAE